MVYLGDIDVNFPSLTPEMNHYFDVSGEKREVVAPSDRVDGLVFARMQRGPVEFAVRVKDIVLEVPLALVPGRHLDGKGLGPKPTTFGDDSAKRLLSDIANANPNLADVVAALSAQLKVDVEGKPRGCGSSHSR